MLTAAFAERVLHQDLFLPSPMSRGATQILGWIQDLVKGGSKKHPITLSNCYSGTAEQGGHMPPNTFKRVTKKQCLVPPPPISSH